MGEEPEFPVRADPPAMDAHVGSTALILGQPLCNTVFLNLCILGIKEMWVMQLNSLNFFKAFPKPRGNFTHKSPVTWVEKVPL